MSDYVACAEDGWGAESFRGETASLYIQAWILESCNKHFSTHFTVDKSDTNTVDRVNLDSVYNLDSTLVSVHMKVLSPSNEGYMFHAGGSAMIDTSNDPYGAIIYGYNETEVMLWRPSPTNTNGHLVYVGREWGDGQSNQESDVVEVIVKVIDITGTPCNRTEFCSPDWSKTRCVSTDCPIPPDIVNAYKLYDGVNNGSKALYSCKTGFTESSKDVITNCVDGTWSMTSMFCKVVCSPPPAVENAAVLVQDNRAKYFCLTGYFTMKNTVDVIECINSTWPSTDFKCIKSCPDPPIIANADVMVSDNVALYSCRQGFLPKSGNNSIKCLQSEWQKTNFTCY
ncbi:complement factor H-like, partial [Saccostrea cucullata]|uniref:complement factor H-like n=1 Tax=Saccostrea cuccullata TaxID=36930 RepID=UPI002ED302E4